MKKTLNKNLKLSKNIFINEPYLIIFKFLNNQRIYNNIYSTNLILLHYFHAFLVRNSFVKLHNFCIFTGRSRGIISFFNMSRLTLRRFFSKNFIIGLHTKIW